MTGSGTNKLDHTAPPFGRDHARQECLAHQGGHREFHTGQPLEHGLRTCWLSLKTAEEMGLDAPTRSCVYYTALLRPVGCTSDATDTAVLAGGDDLAFNAAMAPMLMSQPGEGMRYFVRHLAEELPVPRRIGRVVQALVDPTGSSRSPDAALRRRRSSGVPPRPGRLGHPVVGPCL